MTDYDEPDVREVRLPKWAQDTIGGLRRELATARREAKIASGLGPADTDTIANPYADLMKGTPLLLPKGVRVRFKLADTTETRHSLHYVDVWVDSPRRAGDQSEVRVMGDQWFLVRPTSSNAISIVMDD